MTRKIAVLPGDGIGPEVVAQGVAALQKVAALFGHQFTFDNALISLQNSSTPATAAVEKPVQPSLRENLMQHLTNLRFRFNDGQLIKHMAYPEVKI